MRDWTIRARRSGVLLGALTGVVATLCTLAPSASAVVQQLPNGHVVSYQPMIGKAPAAPKNFDGAFSNLDYNGGPVMPSNTDYVIYWEPNGYATPYPSDYRSGLNRYFTDLAHDSGGNKNVDSVAGQYNDAAGNFSKYDMSFGGPIQDTDAYPANGCTSAALCLTDAQLQAELKKVVAANHLPTDLEHEYFLLTPPHVESCFTSTDGECSAGSNSGAFCAYHGETQASTGTLVYTNDPYVTGNSGCDNGQHPNGTSDGALQGGLSHEHNESTTDPFPNTAWTDYTTGSTTGSENGDKCSAAELGFSGAYGTPLGTAPNGSPYNQVINGHEYLYQQEWSNQGHKCLQRFTFSGAEPTAQFTTAPGAGTVMNFDAAGSTAPGGVADYHWEFENTLGSNVAEDETTSPTDSHDYGSSDTAHTVSLTVYAPDGTSIGATRVIDAGHAGPNADFAVTPTVAAVGQAASFAGTFSGPSGDAASSENWNFGDGSATGSGLRVSHAYGAAGTYRVTLTLTDTLGQQTTATKLVTAQTPPTPAFSILTAPARQGQPVAFDGSASQGGTKPIASYSWNFGDGSAAGSGAAPTHAYAAPGPYTVTLTVTDSSGVSASSSRQLTVLGLPTAAISVATADPVAGSAVAFSGAGSSEAGGSIVSYSWSFGDGTAASSGVTPSHTYGQAGTYTVSLTVTDAAGTTGSATAPVTVGAIPPSPPPSPPPGALPRVAPGVPSAAFTTKTKHPVAGVGVSFDGSTSTDRGATLVASGWSFGDGQTGSGASLSHTYKRVGHYTVTLTVTDSSGATSSQTGQVTIGAPTITEAKFTAGKQGAFRLRLTFDGPGVLTAGSKRVVIRQAGTITLHYKLSRSQLARLHRRHTLKLAVELKFVPGSGGTDRKTVVVKLRTK
jgi:PKD repeat protein